MTVAYVLYVPCTKGKFILQHLNTNLMFMDKTVVLIFLQCRGVMVNISPCIQEIPGSSLDWDRLGTD